MTHSDWKLEIGRINGVRHYWICKRERRKDRFGQVVRMRCRCGAVTNWHTDDWKAKAAMYQLHEYQHITLSQQDES